MDRCWVIAASRFICTVLRVVDPVLMTPTSWTSNLLVTAPPEIVWGLVSDPAQHHRFDATGMVVGLSSNAPEAVGDVFTMDMAWRNGDNTENYQSDNLVIHFVPLRAITWATALPGQQPLGWTWTYDLIAKGPNTRVTLTYDWTETSPENIKRFGVPLTDEHGLAASLRLLARACEGLPRPGSE